MMTFENDSVSCWFESALEILFRFFADNREYEPVLVKLRSDKSHPLNKLFVEYIDERMENPNNESILKKYHKLFKIELKDVAYASGTEFCLLLRNVTMCQCCSITRK